MSFLVVAGTAARYPMWARERRRMLAALSRHPVPAECSACGQIGEFQVRPVLNRRLVRQWGLDRKQRTMINIQQGHTCVKCGNNLRGRSLADAITARLGVAGPLSEALVKVSSTSILEINPAARLTPILGRADRHVCTRFPEVDMRRLPFDTGKFDLVVHSDTLEHVADPVIAIRECLRVARQGWSVFTTPILYDRRTRSRSGLPASFHGGDSGRSLVHWEFGTDINDLLFEAGAKEILVTDHGYPYACAVACR